MSAANSPPYGRLDALPRTVREALDWLVQLKEGGGSGEQKCAEVIKKVLGNNSGVEEQQVKDVCQKAKDFRQAIAGSNTYLSAYSKHPAEWASLCGSKPCCKISGQGGCSSCNTGSCDGCCAKCPKQICARIFCLIVPVLYRVFWYMQVKCNKGKAWEKQQLNGTSGTDLKNFMLRCGFKSDELADNKKGEDLTKNRQAGLLELVTALGTIKGAIEKALHSDKHDPSKNFLKDASNQQDKKPSSLTDLLLWLQFLPYCSEYKKVLDAVKEKLNGSGSSNGNENIVTHLKNAVSELPMLFLQIEGKGERGNTSPVHGSSLFLKIAELSKCQYIFDQKYYEEGTVVKMLLCVFPVIHWGLTAVKDRCTTGSCGNTIDKCDKTKTLLQSLGWNGSKESNNVAEYKPIINDKTKCKDLKDYLSIHFIGNIVGFTGLKRILESAWKEQNGPTGFNNNGQYLPRTIYEMLIWLMGLPVSDKFKELKQNGVSNVMPEFTKILFQVPHLFLTLNGDLSGMLNKIFQCHNIDGQSTAYQYGNDGSECLKIFSAIVVILFPVIRYLQQRCKGDAQAFANGESWSTKQINADGLKTYLNFAGFEPLSDTFKQNGQTFHDDVLKKIFGDLTGQNGNDKLKQLYNCAVKAIQNKNSTGGSHTPSTIRQMMLWLIGLPVTTQYGDNGNGLIKTVTTAASKITELSSKINNGPTSFQYQFQHSIVGMMTIINQVEGGLKSVLEFLKDGFKDKNGGSSGVQFKYGSNDELFTSFTTYVTSVHVQLRFLYVMCGRQKDQGGWKDCHYAMRSYSSSSGVPGTILCKCHRGGGVACGKEPLRNFLTNNGNGTGQNGKNTFKLCQNGDSKKTEHLQMGFRQYETPQSQVVVPGQQNTHTGNEIYTHLKEMLDDIPTTASSPSPSEASKPLSLLTQYCVAIGQLHPSSLGDLFAFFLKLGTEWESLTLYGDNGEMFKQKLQTELNGYQIGNNGEQEACDQLKEKIIALFSIHTSHTEKDLMSLMCDQSTCTPYMKSLSQGLYQYYCPEITGAGDSTKFGVFQYLYDMLKKLLDKMKELQKEFNECPCCQSGKSCDGLISCPNAHPILYKFGFVFGEPSKLNGNSGTSKKCRDIKAQLDAVLSCTQGSESALFSAFECVIQVTYKVLLERARGIIDGKYDTKNGDSTTEGLKSTNTEMNTAFTLYVHNAMYNSYPKLICTFACKVFDGKHECQGDTCENRFKTQIAEPEKEIKAVSSTTLQVTKSPVTTITAVIPSYTAPVIDRCSMKKSDTESKEKASDTSSTSTSYTFSDAIDFHVRGAQCISPSPVALRSVIDWILRVTTGAIATQEGNENGDKNNNSNGNIKEVSGAIKKVFQECGVSVTTDTEVQPYVVSLVQGLRKFMGYTDKSQSVKEGVKKALGDAKETNNNGVKGALKEKIDAIEKFIGENGKANFGTELGKALLKGRYECKHSLFSEVMRTISAVVGVVTGYKKDAEPKAFKEVVELFTSILKAEHKNCDQKAINCKTLKLHVYAKNIVTHNLPYGLSQLHDFFQQIQYFAKEWDSIGKKNGGSQPNTASSSVVQEQKEQAIKANWSFNGSSPQTNGDYFTKLHQALNALGECHSKVQELENNSNGYNNSKEYRNKISAVITHLREQVLSMLKESKDTGKTNNEADPVYAVNGAQRLIEETKKGVECYITGQIRNAFEFSYTYYGYPSDHMSIKRLLEYIPKDVNRKIDVYKSHLDDLKQLCQWLYRMGQLYAHGLKGFVESLVKHLEHIHTVICWIEGIEKMVTKLKDISKEDGVAQTISDFNDIQYCCTTHQSLYNTNSTSFSSRDGFFTALNCRIDHLLTSYVLNELPDSTDKSDVDKRIKFLTDLRLLALDRYNLQVWQDECKNGNCKIKNWITFEGGIVRHSDLNAIKQQLSALTGIAYNNASPHAPHSPTHRIHNFHAICVIQRFSYEAPIIRLERSLKELNKIKEKLNEVKKKCNSVTQDVSNVQDEQQVIQPFCQSVSQFLEEPYGVYSFAKFVHTIMGPNIFSAVIGALEELKESNKYKKNNGKDGNLDKIKGILGVMTEGLDGENNKEHYKLTHICDKLQDFISTLRKEYIFAYPVVTATATQAIASPPIPSAKNPTCDNDDHSIFSICHHCHPFLARIFIGAIPNLYRHCRLLYEMCKCEGKEKHGLWCNDTLTHYNNGIHYHDPCYQALGVYMSWRGWQILKDCQSSDEPMYDLEPLKTGAEICKFLESIITDTPTGALVAKGEDNVSTTDLQPLDQLFKAVMQHFKKERNKKRQQREKALEDEFKNDSNNAGIPFQPPPPVLPSTVRQVLFWLHEMDTNKAFYDDMSQHIEALCTAASRTVGISQETILHVLKLSITQCLEVLATIEDPGRQNAQYLYDLYTEEHYYAYPTVNIPLFFYTFVEKLMGAFLELNFVCVQCEFGATEGGWRDCHIGKSEHSMEGQNCRCTKPHTTVSSVIRVSVEGSVVCPRPLSAFLFSDPKNQLKVPTDPNHRLPYMSKGTMPCGFKLKNIASTDATSSTPTPTPTPTPAPTSVSGSVLVEPLRKLVGGHVTGRYGSTTTNGLNTLSTVIYLRDLLRYTLCLAVRPPWSMSENMAFFYRVTESWKNKGVGSARVAHHNAQLLGAIHAEIDLFPGTFDGKKLTAAVERFAGIEDTEHQKNTAVSPQNSHQFDLRTLMGCQELSATSSGATPVQCSPFMFPLALDVYTHFDERNSRAYLSWILNFAFGIYGQLKSMEEMIKEKECVVKHGSQSNPSTCPSLPMCPGVLTALYQSGSSFMDQGQLAKKENNKQSGTNTTKKTCRDFKTVLSGLFNCDSSYCTPLHNLIVQCEAFLWSIRLPFSLVQLSLWSFAVFFISYVFVVPLDHFKIKSHLFNRLKYTMHPSLLIADGQRRVSEVAYFSL